MLIAALAGAGALGAVLRHAIVSRADAPQRRARSVLAVNCVGSAVLGALVGAARSRGLASDAVVVLGAGLCGGFTTLSTFAHLSVLLGGASATRRTAVWFAAASLVLPALAAGVAFAAAT